MNYTVLVVNVRIFYVLFIGVLFTTFVGVGIDTFYPEPERSPYALSQSPTPIEQKAFEDNLQQNKNEERTHHKNVSIVSLVFAVLATVMSLVFIKQFLLISDGLLLGGFLTLLYSIFFGFLAEDSIFRFVVVTVGLAISLVVGYKRFGKPAVSPSLPPPTQSPTIPSFP